MPAGARTHDTWAPIARSDVDVAVIDGEMVIFDPSSSLVHQLNPVGAVVWQLLDGAATVDELVADLADGFGVPLDQVRHDVAALLEMLETQDLLDDGDRPPPPAAPFPADRAEPAYLVDPPAP